MKTIYPELPVFIRKMEADGLGAPAVQAFCDLYHRYRRGDPGKLPWDEIKLPEPEDIVDYQTLLEKEVQERGTDLLDQLVVISLNGGLGTTMKLNRAKSLINVLPGQTFLDLTAKQILDYRAQFSVRIPWILMDSFHTQKDTLEALADYKLPVEGLPLDFLQHRVPRINRATAMPLELPDDDVNWAPPGHGDIYLALWLCGLLEQLLSRGFRWAFVSNIDNLGGTLDTNILGYMDLMQVEFVIEVTAKSPADIKGGTLVRYRDRLMLLERSQVEEQHLEQFQDTNTFAVFNTNNVWWRLDRLLERLKEKALHLPMIVNPKLVQGVEVVQLETAMGAAIGSFDRALGIHVSRERFAPVKATCDLLAVRSDAYTRDKGYGIRPNPKRRAELGPPVITLDQRFYQGIDDFEARFPDAPSMIECRSLVIEGDLFFGRGVTLVGDVVLKNRSGRSKQIPDDAVFSSGTYIF